MPWVIVASSSWCSFSRTFCATLAARATRSHVISRTVPHNLLMYRVKKRRVPRAASRTSLSVTASGGVQQCIDTGTLIPGRRSRMPCGEVSMRGLLRPHFIGASESRVDRAQRDCQQTLDEVPTGISDGGDVAGSGILVPALVCRTWPRWVGLPARRNA
jgi:hypothetical protein